MMMADMGWASDQEQETVEICTALTAEAGARAAPMPYSPALKAPVDTRPLDQYR
jgi:hypothetical protein